MSGRSDPLTGRSAARLAKYLETALAVVDLSLPQYRVLLLLSAGSSAASVLASRLAVSPPSVTALVDGLAARGLVERQPVAGDRRRVAHVLTDEGRDVLVRADAAVNGRLDDIAGYLDPAERTQAVHGLALWHKAMDAYLAERVTAGNGRPR